MKVIELEQNTPQWLAFRRRHIGASDASVILGVNPWKFENDLWAEKVLGWSTPDNPKMVYGRENEERARKYFSEITGTQLNPVVAESEEYPFISASFDGMSADRKVAVEIKCGRSAFNTASCGMIPDYYVVQMQHQMYVAKLKKMYYFAYYEGEGISLICYRNDELIEHLIEREKAFWETVI